MKKMILTALVLCIPLNTALCGTAVLADDAPAAEANVQTEPTVYNITLDEAIEMAYKDNVEIRANELEQYGDEKSIAVANLAKKSANSTLNNLPASSSLAVSSNFQLYLTRDGYYLEAQRAALRIAQKQADKIKNTIAYNVTNSYYNLVLCSKLVNAAQNSYNLAAENQRFVEKQLALGMVAQLDYRNACLATQSSANALASYKLNRDIACDNLKILLNIDGENCTVNPTDDIECAEYISNVEKDIESAMESRFDLYSLMENRALAEQYFEHAKALTEKSAEYNTAYASYIKADYNYTNTKKLIALSIRQADNAMITASSDMEVAKSKYEITQSEYESSKLKYELGMITNTDLTEAINSLYQAQVSYANAKLNYRMAVEKYKYEISTGL